MVAPEASILLTNKRIFVQLTEIDVKQVIIIN